MFLGGGGGRVISGILPSLALLLNSVLILRGEQLCFSNLHVGVCLKGVRCGERG